MERLTKQAVSVDEGSAKFLYPQIFCDDMSNKLCDLILNGPTINGVHKDSLRKLLRQFYERLKSIEDILGDEYDLDRLRERVAADREGRCAVLPCKVGDYAHFLVPDLIDGDIDVEKIMVSEVGSKGFWVSKYTAKPNEMHDFTPWEELGVSVFLTYEEAEAAQMTMEEIANG